MDKLFHDAPCNYSQGRSNLRSAENHRTTLVNKNTAPFPREGSADTASADSRSSWVVPRHHLPHLEDLDGAARPREYLSGNQITRTGTLILHSGIKVRWEDQPLYHSSPIEVGWQKVYWKYRTSIWWTLVDVAPVCLEGYLFSTSTSQTTKRLEPWIWRIWKAFS